MKPSKHGREVQRRGGKEKITPPKAPFAACRTLLYKKHQLPPCPKGGNTPGFLETSPAFPGLAPAYLFILHQHNNHQIFFVFLFFFFFYEWFFFFGF